MAPSMQQKGSERKSQHPNRQRGASRGSATASSGSVVAVARTAGWLRASVPHAVFLNISYLPFARNINSLRCLDDRHLWSHVALYFLLTLILLQIAFTKASPWVRRVIERLTALLFLFDVGFVLFFSVFQIGIGAFGVAGAAMTTALICRPSFFAQAAGLANLVFFCCYSYFTWLNADLDQTLHVLAPMFFLALPIVAIGMMYSGGACTRFRWLLFFSLAMLFVSPLKLKIFMQPSPKSAARNLAQPGVELAFENHEPAKAALCDPATRTLVVVPKAEGVIFLRPDGAGPVEFNTKHEAAVTSFIFDGKLMTSSQDNLLVFDVRNPGPPIATYRVFPNYPPSEYRHLACIHLAKDLGLLSAWADPFGPCSIFEVKDLSTPVFSIETVTVGDCRPVDQDRVVVSEMSFGYRKISLIDRRTKRVTAVTRLPDSGLGVIEVDYQNKRIYALSTLLGVIYVLDSNTLQLQTMFFSHFGLKHMLPEPVNGRIYASTYLDGVVTEHDARTFARLRTWQFDGPLRAINWGCDGSLLLVTRSGGYRVRVAP